MKAALRRREHYNSAHRLHNPDWTAKKNIGVFGKCNNPNFHRHNYELEAIVIGEIDAETGFVMDSKLLSDLIKEHVLEAFDHKNLNTEVLYYRNLNPTAENIARVIYAILKPLLHSNLNLKIRLYET